MAHAMRDFRFESVTPPAAILDNTAITTTEIDTQGYDEATILVYLGATDIALTVLKVQESDTSGSGFTDVSGLDFDGDTDIDNATAALPTATDDNKLFVFHVDLKGKKRYLDVSATIGNGTSGGFVTILCLLTRGGIGGTTPVSVSARNLGGALRA